MGRKPLKSKVLGKRLKTLRPRLRLADYAEQFEARWVALHEALDEALHRGDRPESARLQALIGLIARQRFYYRTRAAHDNRRYTEA